MALLPDATAAAAWGVFAFGDAAASLVGRHVRAPSLFGHRKATWSGTGAFLLVGTAVGWGMGAFVSATGGSAAVPLAWVAAAAFGGALVDLVRLPPDDNLPIAAVAGLVLAAGTGLLG